jgi:excinuclease ABC subunit B
MTRALTYAVDETHRRRAIQMAYNEAHGITPTTVIKNIKDITAELRTEHQKAVDTLVRVDEEEFLRNPKGVLAEKRQRMEEAVQELDFETAALIRDEIRALEEKLPKKLNTSARRV